MDIDKGADLNQKINDEIEKFDEEAKKEEFPQYLCKTCGKCCKSITTCYTHEQLEEMAARGAEEAKVFTEIFKRFPSIEEARKVIPEQIDQVLNFLSNKEDFDISNITFYYCPHISDKGLCSIYEKRPNCCRRAPQHGWSVMPPGCGFEGWQYEQREKQKKLVRAVKEYLYAMENLSVDGKVPGKDMTIEELRQRIEEKIEPWKKYGSMFW